jgi:aldose 1-epimerase
MAFSVEHTVLNNRSFIHLKNDDVLAVTIVPSVGAMLQAMQIKLSGSDFNVIESDPLPEISAESAGVWFKGVKLSPWPCRIPNGKYKFGKREFKVNKMFKDGTALHGLLFDQAFQQVDEFANEDTAYVVLRHNYEGSDPGYPFIYQCDVKYALHPARLLEVETTVSNLSDEEIPIADGWHPYFQLGGMVDEWEMNFPTMSMVEFDERLVPTGLLVPYQKFNEPKKIGNTKLDNCFFLKVQEFKPVCSLHNPANNLSVHFYTNPSYSYLQVFIPPHRKSIAIENLSSAPDTFNNQMGLIRLQPGDTRSFRVFYQVEVEENI